MGRGISLGKDMQKLFEVVIEKTVYVMADTDDEAEVEAESIEAEEQGDAISCREIKGVEEVQEDWRDAIPWNTQEDLTIRKILEQPAPPEKPYDHPDQMKFGFPQP